MHCGISTLHDEGLIRKNADTYLIRIIMSNMEEKALIQIFQSFNFCTTFYSLSNIKCNIKFLGCIFKLFIGF